jgi:hypothetical protein
MDTYTKQFIDYINHNDSYSFATYLESNPDKLTTYDFSDREDNEYYIDMFRLACSNNNIAIAKIILNHLEKTDQQIYSGYRRLCEQVCRKKNIDILKMFFELFEVYKDLEPKTIFHKSLIKMLSFLNSDDGFGLYGYNSALFYLEKDIVIILKSRYNCKLYDYVNYPFYLHRKDILELHNMQFTN